MLNSSAYIEFTCMFEVLRLDIIEALKSYALKFVPRLIRNMTISVSKILSYYNN